MKKLLLAVGCALALAGCEHINFEFDWGMLAKSVWHQLQK